MDARAVLKADLQSRNVTEGPASSGRTLAEMAGHVLPRNEGRDILRHDVAGGRVEPTRPHVEPAEWAKDWKLRWTGGSGAAREHAHASGAAFVDAFGGRPGAKEIQCHADM